MFAESERYIFLQYKYAFILGRIKREARTFEKWILKIKQKIYEYPQKRK